jgi:hypothetical protein
MMKIDAVQVHNIWHMSVHRCGDSATHLLVNNGAHVIINRTLIAATDRYHFAGHL